MVLAGYREAVNIPNDDGYLPIHLAARFSSVDVMKMIAEENMSNLSVIEPIGSVAHFAVQRCSLKHLQYIQSVMPEQLLSLNASNQTPLHLLNYSSYLSTPSSRVWHLSSPLSAGSEVLRFLLRHCPSLVTARNSVSVTLYQEVVLWSLPMPAACCCWRELHRCILECCRSRTMPLAGRRCCCSTHR